MTYKITMYNKELDVHASVDNLFVEYAFKDAKKLEGIGFTVSFGYIDIPEDQRKEKTPAGVYYVAYTLEELARKMEEFKL